MGRSQEDQIDGGERRMKIAEEYLLARGTEDAMSFAIEDGQDLSVLRTLIELGAKVWRSSWNVACYTGNFKIMEFLDSKGYWSEISPEAISNAIRAGQLEVAKWLRAHDPPAPWKISVTNACVCVWAKAAGVSIRTHKPGDPTQGLKVFQPSENIEFYGQFLQPKDLPQPLLQEMADWLVSEGAPFATEMMGEIKKLKEHKEAEAARNGKPEIQMEIARKYLMAFGKENAMSHAIEHLQDVPVLRALIELGAKVMCTSWNMACYTGNFKTIGFLDKEGYWSEIHTDTMAYAVMGGQLRVAKWLRAHDPPAPWNYRVSDGVIAAASKAAGVGQMITSSGSGDHKLYRPEEDEYGVWLQMTAKNLPMPLIEEMADWLVSEGAPEAARMASDVNRVKTFPLINRLIREGEFDKAVPVMVASGNYPDRMEEVPFGLYLEQRGMEPHIIMGPTALSFGKEAVSTFSHKQMMAAERMQRAYKAKEYKEFLAISKESGLTPEKIGGVPFDPETHLPKRKPPTLSFEEASALSAGKLKKFLLKNDVDITGCLMKSDLKRKLKNLYL